MPPSVKRRRPAPTITGKARRFSPKVMVEEEPAGCLDYRGRPRVARVVRDGRSHSDAAAG